MRKRLLRMGWLLAVLATNVAAQSLSVRNAVSQGNAKYLSGDFVAASNSYQSAINEDTTYAIAHANLALACARLGVFDSAESNALLAVSLDTAEPKYRLNLGKILAMQGKYVGATNALTFALGMNPAYKQAYFNRGWCLDEMGQYAAAEVEYRTALNIDSSYAKPMLGLALVKARQALTEESEWWCLNAVCVSLGQTGPMQALSRRNLAVLRGPDFAFEQSSSTNAFTSALALLVADRTEEAVTAFGSLVAVETNSAIARLLYAQALVDRGNASAANTQLTAARVLMPSLSADSSPTGLPVRVDFTDQGHAPAALSLLPSWYGVSVKNLPWVGSAEVCTTGGAATIVLAAEAGMQSVNLGALVVGTSVSNALASSQTYRIDASQLMSALWLMESGAAGSGDFAAYRMALLNRSGFFGAVDSNLNVTVSSGSPNVSVTKASASLSAGDRFIEFFTPTNYPAYPQRRDVVLPVSWTTARSAGSFSLRFLTLPPTPPLTDGFEAASLDGLANYWSFDSTVGSLALSTVAPHGGTYALAMSDTVDRGSASAFQEAVLRVNLAAMTNAVLDCYVKEHDGTASSGEIAVSVDGTVWKTAYTIPGTPVYEHCAVDLGGLGLVLDNEVFIRFRHSSQYKGGFTWDDVRIGTDRGVFGPRVAEATPIRTGGSSGAVTGIRIRFDKAIDPATFTWHDVTITAPGGAAISLAGNPVDSGDHTSFDAVFGAGNPASGVYFISIGPSLTDPAGTRMDQDHNGLPGDPFSQALTVGASPQALPYVQGFESGDLTEVLAAWEFKVDGGAIAVGAGHAREGSYALELSQPQLSDYNRWQEAALHLNLTNQTGVVLDFWALEFANGGTLEAALSVDGANWRTLKSLTGPGGGWRQHWVDLDAAAAAAGWSYTGDVRVRFRMGNSYYAAGFALDGVRVRAGQAMPTMAAAAPYTEGFESGDISALGPWWEFADTYNTFSAVSPARSHGGTGSLDLYGANTSSRQQDAVLHANLLGLSGVTLDFWAWEYVDNGNGALNVQWSVDGASWRTLLSAGDTGGGWRHFSANLDADRAAAGWSYTGDVRIRFRNDSYYSAFALDDVRVALEGPDPVFGPRVAACSLAGQTVAGPVSAFTVTFNEPVDPATFAAADVSLTGPSGSAIPVASVTDSGTHTNFTVTLSAPQGLAGLYRLTVGPAVTDAVGNDMDQDQNGITGDGYAAAFTVEVVPATPPFAETFEAGTIEGLRSCWAFTVNGGTARVDSGHAREGSYALELSQPQLSDYNRWQEAALHLNLTNQTGVVLDFWALEFANGGTLEAALSVDGANWRTLKSLTGPGGGWRQHWVDLDAAAAAAGWSYTGDVRVRFRMGNSYYAAGFALDGVRVRAGQAMPTMAAAAPYTEGFESGDISALGPWWEFADTYNTFSAVSPARSHGGTGSLDLYGANTSSRQQDAVLHANLLGLSGVTLDFWAWEYVDNGNGALNVQWSVDGASWRTLLSAGDTGGGWRHFSANLDADRAAAGWSYTGDVRIRFRNDSYYSAFALDDVRVALEGPDPVFGPRVAACSLAGQTVAGPVTQFAVTFSEPVDPASFAGQVRVNAPGGMVLPVASVTAGANSNTVMVTLSGSLTLSGSYGITLLAGITDLNGNPLDQNGDGYSGDGYSTTFTISDPGMLPASYPFHEPFDVGFGTRNCWRFQSTANGRIQFVDDTGDLVLRMDCQTTAWSTNTAILAINLAGQSGVKLFWDEYNPYDEQQTGAGGDGVFASVDQGANWLRIADMASPNSSARQRKEVDLDAAFATNGLAYTADVRIKFQHCGQYAWSSGGRQIDDIAVSWERNGPKVLSHSPTRLPDGSSLSSITLVFSEAMTPATFTVDDIVSFAGPSGDLLAAVTGVSMIGSTGTVFFAAQSVPGAYTLVVGPYIHDLAMAPMDQDASGQTHTVTDRYTARVAIGVATMPYYEPFDASVLPAAWDTWSSGNGRVRLANGRLEMDSASDYALNEAILHINLTGVTTRVTLSFYHLSQGDETHTDSLAAGQTFTGHRNADLVAVSSDGGATWRVVQMLGASGTVTLTLEPDVTAQSPDFLIKFQQYDNYEWGTDGRAFDDVRVYNDSFESWLSLRGVAGDPATLFGQISPEDGVPYAFVYAFGSNLSAGEPLLTIRIINGRPIVETPAQQEMTRPFIVIRIVGTTDLSATDWTLPVVPAADTAGKPENRDWYEPGNGLPEKGFFRLETDLK